jgi:NTP pyrophosphatase (non-canonical NTP hydrolase)
MNLLPFNLNDPLLDNILKNVVSEMNRAAKKHPDWPTCPVKRAAIVAEEAGEVIREANHIEEGHGDLQLLAKELEETAGTCLRMLLIMHKEKIEVEQFIKYTDAVLPKA